MQRIEIDHKNGTRFLIENIFWLIEDCKDKFWVLSSDYSVNFFRKEKFGYRVVNGEKMNDTEKLCWQSITPAKSPKSSSVNENSKMYYSERFDDKKPFSDFTTAGTVVEEKVCVWKRDYESDFIVGCRPQITINKACDSFVFCPYCGRKIEVKNG